MKKVITTLSMVVLALLSYGQYQMEYVTRGVVAVRTGNNNFVSWRWLGTEDDIVFNLYRNGTKVNANPLKVTNYTDNDAPANANYTVRAIVNNIEQIASEAATTWGQNYLTIPLQRPSNIYSPNDCSVADVDGDGVYEILLKWEPNDAKDAAYAGVTSNVFIDCIRLNGSRLWRIDLGRNIRAGAHYTQMAFYDFDGDGKAEFMCKTADGTKDGVGKVIGSSTANYVNGDGKILSGPEFLTVFNGLTGAAMATANYIPARGGNGSGWGDPNGNRVDRFRVGVAYLDGKRPSALFGRGYYTRLVMAAWDWRDGKLTNRWTFDSNTPGNAAFRGQGNHSLSIADVDNDGKQEIISGAAVIDDDGKPYYSTGFGHGDAGHVSDLDPDLPGIEVVNIQESYDDQGLYMYSATNKRVLWAKPSVLATTDREGPARGVSADISAAHRGAESWARGAVSGVYNAKGARTSLSTPASCNFLSWWDGDLLRELLDGTSITKYGGGTLLNASGCSSNNSTKSTPCLSGDIFGDWREEVIFRTTDNSSLRIYTTTIPSTYKFRTLVHDPQYRMALAWQNGAYNQPPHVGFYLGDGMDMPAKPNIEVIKDGGVITDLEAGDAMYSSSLNQGVSYSPNPFNEELYLQSNEEFEYTIYDLLGNEMERGQGQNSYYAGHQLLSGMYLVSTKSQSGSKNFKVTKN